MALLRRVKKAATVAGTFACALLIGYVMQYGDADASRFSSVAMADADADLPAQLDTSPLQFATTVAQKVPAPAQLTINRSETMRVDASSVKLTALVADDTRTVHQLGATFVARPRYDDTPSCPIALSAAPQPEATLAVSVRSVCRAGMEFEAKHGAVLITGRTDERGFAEVRMPALTTAAEISLMFADGDMKTTTATVPDAADYNRIVFQWRGHAAEFIHTVADVTVAGGKIERFGTDVGPNSHFAEVYSFPSTTRLADGVGDLTVRADVTDQSCGRRLLAERVHYERGISPDRKDIRITLPSCDFTGTFLELKKVLGGQTLLQ